MALVFLCLSVAPSSAKSLTLPHNGADGVSGCQDKALPFTRPQRPSQPEHLSFTVPPDTTNAESHRKHRAVLPNRTPQSCSVCLGASAPSGRPRPRRVPRGSPAPAEANLTPSRPRYRVEVARLAYRSDTLSPTSQLRAPEHSLFVSMKRE